MRTFEPCDVLIVGGGGAGLRAAIEAKRLVDKVALVCKGEAGQSGSTMYAGCSMIAALPTDPPEALEVHFKDTMAVGKFLNDEALVEELVTHAGKEILALEALGVKLHTKKGGFLLGRGDEAILPSGIEPDYTGYGFSIRGSALTQPLAEQARRLGVTIINHLPIVKLFRYDGEVWGTFGFDTTTGEVVFLPARAVILATGGAGWLYAVTSNSPDLTGDSYTLALDVGATVKDMEFVEFNPCRLLRPQSLETNLPPDLFSFGGVLRNVLGERFILTHNPLGEEASFREEMPRLLLKEVVEGRGVDGGVYLDATAISMEVWQDRYPFLFDALLREGIDPRKDFLVVGVRANLFTGGVKVRTRGRTEIPGLYAAGEAVGGVHGAKRFGGNAVAHTQVSGALAGREAALYARTRRSIPTPPASPLEFHRRPGEASLSEVEAHLRRIMWEQVGLLRSAASLKRAHEEIQACRSSLEGCAIRNPKEWLHHRTLQGMCVVAEAVTVSALTREESRGPHYRNDHPFQDKRWLGSVEVRLRASTMEVTFSPKER